jgi:hypothetical protein
MAMRLRLTFIDTHVHTCETEAPDDLDVVDLNTLSEFVYSQMEAAVGERWAEVVDANWVDSQIVDVKVKDPAVKNPAAQWVGLEKLRPRMGVQMLAPAPAAPRIPPPAPTPEMTLF